MADAPEADREARSPSRRTRSGRAEIWSGNGNPNVRERSVDETDLSSTIHDPDLRLENQQAAVPEPAPAPGPVNLGLPRTDDGGIDFSDMGRVPGDETPMGSPSRQTAPPADSHPADPSHARPSFSFLPSPPAPVRRPALNLAPFRRPDGEYDWQALAIVQEEQARLAREEKRSLREIERRYVRRTDRARPPRVRYGGEGWDMLGSLRPLSNLTEKSVEWEGGGEGWWEAGVQGEGGGDVALEQELEQESEDEDDLYGASPVRRYPRMLSPGEEESSSTQSERYRRWAAELVHSPTEQQRFEEWPRHGRSSPRSAADNESAGQIEVESSNAGEQRVEDPRAPGPETGAGAVLGMHWNRVYQGLVNFAGLGQDPELAPGMETESEDRDVVSISSSSSGSAGYPWLKVSRMPGPFKSKRPISPLQEGRPKTRFATDEGVARLLEGMAEERERLVAVKDQEERERVEAERRPFSWEVEGDEERDEGEGRRFTVREMVDRVRRERNEKQQRERERRGREELEDKKNERERQEREKKEREVEAEREERGQAGLRVKRRLEAEREEWERNEREERERKEKAAEADKERMEGSERAKDKLEEGYWREMKGLEDKTRTERERNDRKERYVRDVAEWLERERKENDKKEVRGREDKKRRESERKVRREQREEEGREIKEMLGGKRRGNEEEGREGGENESQDRERREREREEKEKDREDRERRERERLQEQREIMEGERQEEQERGQKELEAKENEKKETEEEREERAELRQQLEDEGFGLFFRQSHPKNIETEISDISLLDQSLFPSLLPELAENDEDSDASLAIPPPYPMDPNFPPDSPAGPGDRDPELPALTHIHLHLTIFIVNRSDPRLPHPSPLISYATYGDVPLWWNVSQLRRFLARSGAACVGAEGSRMRLRVGGRWLKRGTRTLREEGLRDYENLVGVLLVGGGEDVGRGWREFLEELDGVAGCVEGWPGRGEIRTPGDRAGWLGKDVDGIFGGRKVGLREKVC